MKNNILKLLKSDKQKNKYDYVFYFRIFEGCNVSCKHCFIPSNPKRMDLNDIKKSIDIVNGIVKDKDKKILIQWHGGEPSIMGADFLNKSMDILDNGVICDIDYGIQTNLVIIDDDLLDIYKNRIAKNQFGVSWDYQIRFLKSSGLNFEGAFWNNFKLVQEFGVDPVATMTSTRQFFNKFKSFNKLYYFCVGKGIKEMHIERLTKTGYARDNWKEIGVTNKEYSDGMSVLANGYFKFKENESEKFSLSPFDGLLKSVLSLNEDEQFSYGCWSGGCDTGFHTIDANGYKSSCTALNSEVDNKPAKVNKNELLFVDGSIAKKLIERRKMCNNCSFNRICSSGCGALDFDDGSGECSGGKGLFSSLNNILFSC